MAPVEDPPAPAEEAKPDEPVVVIDREPASVAEAVDVDEVMSKVRRLTGKDSRAISLAVRGLLELTPAQFEIAKKQPQTVAEQVAVQIVSKAKDGVQDAIKTCLERTEGRVPQPLEVNTNAHKEVHERVDDIARERLNQSAAAAYGGALPQAGADLDVPDDGGGGSEDD